MKLRLFIVSASLTTVGFLGPLPSAFGHSIDLQTNTKEAQLLEDEFGSSRGALAKWINNQEMVQEDNASESVQFLPIAVTPQATESSKANLAEQTDPVNSISLRIFVTFGFISGGLLWLRQSRNYKEQRAKHVIDILQKIETLERIIKRKPDIYKSISPVRKEYGDTLKSIQKINP